MEGSNNSGFVRIAVFCSGNGSNFEALVRASRKRKFCGEIVLMVVDNPNAFAIKRAERLKVPVLFINPSDFGSKKDYEKLLIKELSLWKIDWILLAGYMRILGPDFVKKYRFRIVNIHPSLLPSFKGRSGIKDAYEYGVKVTGVTVHFVDEGIDSGPIILQKAVPIREGETIESLERRIHRVEHKLYPEAVRLLLEGKCRIVGRKVVISG